MPSQSITARLPPILIDKLEAYIAESGSSKTDVVVAALSQYLGVSTDVPLTEKVACLVKIGETEIVAVDVSKDIRILHQKPIPNC